MQFGPSSRMPASAARCFTCCSSRAASASPVSLNRPVKRCSARTPFALLSSISASTPSAGMHEITYSTSPGTADSDGYAGNPMISGARGLIGYTAPANPNSTIERT